MIKARGPILETRSSIKEVVIQFDHSSPSAPRIYGIVEWKFQIVHGYIRAMLNGASLQHEIRHAYRHLN
jgi:hypothetical protein